MAVSNITYCVVLSIIISIGSVIKLYCSISESTYLTISDFANALIQKL